MWWKWERMAASIYPSMNLQLQTYIDAMPDQYYWVHKRFKTRPPGETGFYG